MATRKARRPHPDDGYVGDPWERQPWDTDTSWPLFQAHRDTPAAERSLSRLASDTGKSRKTLEDHSSRYNWRERLHAWDGHLDVIRRNEQIQEAIDMGRRHARQLAMLENAAVFGATALAKKITDNPKDLVLGELAEEDTQRLIALALAGAKVYPALAQAERLARGYSTEHVEVSAQLETPEGEVVGRIMPVRTADRVAGILGAFAEAGLLPAGLPQLEPGDA